MGQAKQRGTLEQRTEKVKRLGQVMTPPDLVNEMLDKLPRSSFTNACKTIIDPSCGTGNFLVEAARRKLANKHSALQVALTIYGIDIDPSMTKTTRERLFQIYEEHTSNQDTLKEIKDILKCHIKTTDFLTFESTMLNWAKDDHGHLNPIVSAHSALAEKVAFQNSPINVFQNVSLNGKKYDLVFA